MEDWLAQERNNSVIRERRSSAPAGAGYFYNAIKVAKSAARLASFGWHRSRQNSQRNDSAATSDTAVRSEEEGQSPSLLPA